MESFLDGVEFEFVWFGLDLGRFISCVESILSCHLRFNPDVDLGYTDLVGSGRVSFDSSGAKTLYLVLR